MATVTIGTKTQQFEEGEFVVEGTAPLLIARAMPWDIGKAFWEEYPREIREAQNPADVLTPGDRHLLKTHGFEVNGKLGTQANAYLRGHWLPEKRIAFPASGFMGACRTAVVQYKGKTKDALTAKKVGGAMQIIGDELDRSLVAIDGEYGVRSPDIGMNSGMARSPRIIVRLQVETGWTASLRVRWLSQLIDVQDVAQVLAWAGNWGIGQWRPSSPHPGPYGTWRIVR